MSDRPQPTSANVLQALLFFPRGGAAQVIRYLTAALSGHQVRSRIISGSLGAPGENAHAPTFFDGLDVLPVDYTPAWNAAKHGRDPLREPVPLHPSYEDRADAPDRVFTAVGPATADWQESRWADLLRSNLTETPDVFHIHHLSPLQSAVRAHWPGTPLVGHIHGTELKMLQGIRDRVVMLGKLGLDVDCDSDQIDATIQELWHELSCHEQQIAESTRWAYWRHARFWEHRMAEYAAMCDRLIVLTGDARAQAEDLLDYDAERIHPVPNGVDIAHFTPDRLTARERLERWREWLVDDPQGWDESGEPGSVRYSQADLERWFLDDDGEQTPVLFFVGRFTSMKRLPLLIRAYKRAQPNFAVQAPLVIWGGNPGEWEDEHPVDVVREENVSGVFFVGWRGHDELPAGLNAADLMVAPSTNEPFGQVYLEAMACRLPVIATLSGGPPSFINRNAGAPEGWLVPPDDESALADAIAEAVNNPDERRRRGENALHAVRSDYSWIQVAATVRDIYTMLMEQR